MRTLQSKEIEDIEAAFTRCRTELRELGTLLTRSAPGIDLVGDAAADMRNVNGSLHDVETSWNEAVRSQS